MPWSQHIVSLVKLLKTSLSFPNADALLKMLYLDYKDLSNKWTMPIRNWFVIITSFQLSLKKGL